MRRMKWAAAILISIALLAAGCSGAKTAESVVKDLDRVIGKMESYRGSGTMTLHTGQQPLEYQVEVWYQKPQYYRIALTNAKKDITQIVLRNDDGVFVLTPKLNKSFRFQSDWPQNQGQVYLYQTLVQSILLDNSRQFADDEQAQAFVFDVMANYQNGSLARQKIWLNKNNYAPQRVEVSDTNANVMVEVEFTAFDFDAKFDKNAFDMAYNMSAQQPKQGEDKPTTALPESDPAGDAGASDPADNAGGADPAETEQQPGDAPAADDSGTGPDGSQHGETDGQMPEGDGAATDDAEGANTEGANAGDNGEAGDDPAAGESAEDGAEGAPTSAEFIIMEPSYIPEGVAVHDISEVTFGGEQGVMMRYSGAYDFTLLQTQPHDMDAALVPGIGIDLGHTMALMSGEEQRTLTWTYDGYEYRLTSASLPDGEMIKVAQSVMDEMNK